MNNLNTQIGPRNPLKSPTENQICKIDISGYLINDYKAFNPEGHTIICRLGETCNGLEFYPETSIIILDNNQQSQLFENFEQLIPGIAKDLQISQAEAIQKSYDFFSNAVVRVEPKGIQGRVYKTMKGIQNYVPFSYTIDAISIAKTTGINGIKTIAQAPLTFVGATYVGAIFFGYVGIVAGDNPVGTVCNATSYLLSRPMRGVEITLNGLILRPISEVIGVPLLLNGTQELLKGKGLSFEEFTKIGIAFERISNLTVVKKAKKIYKILRNKD